MDFTAENIKDTLIVTIGGELDDHAAKRIRQRLDYTLYRKDIKNIIFDLTKLELMDSAGIGLLVGRYKQIKAKNGKVNIVTSKNTNILKLIKMSGVANLFGCFDNIADAKSNLRDTQRIK